VQQESRLTERDRARLSILVVATLIVRAFFTVVRKVDSDEPQHLHVAWAWAKGLVQYRDVFDNHLPLLHMLFAPAMALAPENSGVFLFMRAAIAPFAIACAYLFYLLVKPLYGTRIAAVAALTFSMSHPWLPKSVEFRNDTLWMFFWLAALLLFTRNRHFLAGVAMSLAFLASVKAAPIVIAHALVFATQRRFPSLRETRSLILGGALPPLLLCLAMFALGAFDEMVYQTLLFNAAAPVPQWRRIAGALGFLVAGSAIFFLGRNRPHLTLFVLWYTSLLLAFWPILTPRDFLPIMPILVLGFVLSFKRLMIAPVVIAIVATAIDTRIWRPREDFRERFVDTVVTTTAPTDYVLDLKGDAIFRRRPVRPIYEDVGRALTAIGKLPDSGPQRMIETGCCAAIRDSGHLPPHTRAFIARHFIGSEPVRYCGTRVTGSSFTIAIPQTYAVVARNPQRVRIDGIPYRGPRRLGAGRHAIDRGGNESVVVIWSRAAKERQ
jgi:hypothetical protein